MFFQAIISYHHGSGISLERAQVQNRTLWQRVLGASLFLALLTLAPITSFAQIIPGCSKAPEGANCRKTCRAVQPPHDITSITLLEGPCTATNPLVLYQESGSGETCTEARIDATCVKTCFKVATGEITSIFTIPPSSGGCTPLYEMDPNFNFVCTTPGCAKPDSPPDSREACEVKSSGGTCTLVCTNFITKVITRQNEVDCATGLPPQDTANTVCYETTQGNGQHCKKECKSKDTGETVSETVSYNGPCGTAPSNVDPEDYLCEEANFDGNCVRNCWSRSGELLNTYSEPGACPDDGAGAGGGGGTGAGGSCADGTGTSCCSTCVTAIPQHHQNIRNNITENFKVLRRWIITQYFKENILPAMALMTEQLVVAGQYQVELIGALFDAKHQLETERIYQQLTARAHKDYQPSEGMCTIATGAKSLATSDRKANMATMAIAGRMMQRQTLNGAGISHQGPDTDKRSRMVAFLSTYCEPGDNQKLLTKVCKGSSPARRNIDVDFTRNIESRLTLDMEFVDTSQNSNATKSVSADEQDVFAMAANLYSNTVVPHVSETYFGEAEKKRVRTSVAEKYLELRSIFAKRSVAQNSFATIVGMRTAGEPGVAPYVKAAMRELGIKEDAEIEKLVGKNPSYFAQMEVLTKKLYQKPMFYTELYDKPVNIERKAAALDAIGLMQDRDLYNSLLRSEAVLSVLLETKLVREQEKVASQKGLLTPTGGVKK